MQLQVPFVQLPLCFDAGRLMAEVDALGDYAWRDHPQKYPGNYALPLISVDGDPDSDAIAGPMRPTPHLQKCFYLQQILARLEAVWGRTRLMKLAPGAEVTPHADINYYWRDRVRVHVPILTHPDVRFICGNAEVNMAAGECWIFDTWRPHRVINPGNHDRIHLVADTVGGARFWDVVEKGRVPGRQTSGNWQPAMFAGNPDHTPAKLLFESVNVPEVMTPWELRNHIQFILEHAEADPQLGNVQRLCARFIVNWQGLWARHGENRDGWSAYRELMDTFAAGIQTMAMPLMLTNGMRFMPTLRSMVLDVALADRREHRLTADVSASTARPETISP